MHDHNTLLKEFIFNNEGKLKKLQDDAKIAQVRVCAPQLHEEGGVGFRKATCGPVPTGGQIPLCLLRVDILCNCAQRGEDLFAFVPGAVPVLLIVLF